MRTMNFQIIDKGSHELHKINGRVSRCVSCNCAMEYSKTTHRCCHKCLPAHENRRMGAHRAQYEPIVRGHSYAERLADGFKMMKSYE